MCRSYMYTLHQQNLLFQLETEISGVLRLKISSTFIMYNHMSFVQSKDESNKTKTLIFLLAFAMRALMSMSLLTSVDKMLPR